MGPKLGLCPFCGAGSQSNTNYTMSPGPRLTSVPSGILIHPGVWPQRTWAQNWGCAPLGGELGPHLTQCGLGPRPHDPSRSLDTIDMGRKLGPSSPKDGTTPNLTQTSHVQHVSDLHLKFALRPHHVWKYGRHPICGGWD